MSDPALEFRNVSKIYEARPPVLNHLSFQIGRGRRVAVVGRSGSGKSTLLHLAAGIDTPSQGKIFVQGHNLTSLSERERTLLRRRHVGLLFQFFHLLPHLTVRQNVALPEIISGNGASGLDHRVDQLLGQVELGDRADDSVEELSGGEMQRVALCRALLQRPALLLADEPTGSLDDKTGRAVMELMLSLSESEGSTLVVVTHSEEVASLADEVWHLQGGSLVKPAGEIT